MNSKIQQLTETIFNEGVQKAKEEAEAIIKEANETASRIKTDAQDEADKLMKETRIKSADLQKQVESEIKMSLNQAVSTVKQEITRLITMQVIKPSVSELFSDKDYLKTLVSNVVKGWMEKENLDLKVILSESDRGQLESYFKNNLATELNKGLEVAFSSNIKSGFKIGPSDNSYLISFTDDDFTNFLKSYLRPKTSQLLFGEKK
ncbi:MAG: V-type ATP synthase subunit E family protein [Prolixibacteraceae bacterium]|jgi:V/A-type H+-transporting ATPase subunit E|nr:V-type ATP synthase subunit E family protein [Prolixibacteraceae bacterium]NLO01418.1 V-type ATP synthase subunit E [Bacteroidales bacterium]